MLQTPSIDPHAPGANDVHTSSHAEADAGGGGLPQFDTSIWFGQIAYLLLLFVVLYLLIAKVFAPRLRRVMDERADTISAAVATARSVQAEAADQAVAAKAEVEAARAESRRVAQEAKAKVAADAESRRGAQEAEVEARIAQAEARIAQTRDAAMGSVATIAADTAAAMVERLTGAPATGAELAAAKGDV